MDQCCACWRMWDDGTWDAALCHLCVLSTHLFLFIVTLLSILLSKKQLNTREYKMKNHDGTSQQKKPTKLKNIADKTEAFDTLHVKNAEVFKKNLLILKIDSKRIRNVILFFIVNNTKWSIIGDIIGKKLNYVLKRIRVKNTE